MAGDETIADRFHRSVAGFGAVLGRVTDADWGRSTPCSDWDVRALVAHVVDEHRWVAPLLAGRTIADVAPELDDDVLGSDAFAAWQRFSAESAESVRQLDDVGQVVHLSFGDTPAREYLAQLSLDHLVHGWDLAQAIGGDPEMDADVVAWAYGWFGPMEELYRAGGVIGARAAIPDDASDRTRLLAMTGRSA